MNFFELEAKSRREEQELFGNKRTLPADESEIVWNRRLTHEEKMFRLTIIRRAKAVLREERKESRKSQPKPKAIVLTFPGLITDADKFHANGLGIQL